MIKNKTIHGLAMGLLTIGIYGGIEFLVYYFFDYQFNVAYHYTALFWVAYQGEVN